MKTKNYNTKLCFLTRVLHLLFGLLLVQNAYSQTREERARQFFNRASKTESARAPQHPLKLKYESESIVETLVTVFEHPNEGFVVICGSDDSNLVAGYSEKGTFDPDSISDGLRNLINLYEKEGAAPNTIVEQNQANYPAISPHLDRKGIALNQYHHEEVGGRWTGCMATAFLQIMAYHQFPDYGIGSHCYTHPTYGELCADYENTFIDWKNIDDEGYKKLSLDLGIAMEMDYARDGSSPTRKDSRYVLEKYYGYHVHHGTPYFDDIYSELSKGRPIYVAIPGEPGHAVVLDGIDAEGRYHLNFGWGGIDNGYYMMPGERIVDHANRVYGSTIIDIVYVSTTPYKLNEQNEAALEVIAKGLDESFGWDLEKDKMKWPGLTIGIARGVVKEIDITSYPYSYVKLPSEISELTDLSRFRISGVKIQEIDLEAFGDLTKLERLHIIGSFQSEARYQMPENIGKLTNLEDLQIEYILNGELPATIGNMKSLKSLYLNNNYLTGSLPKEIAKLENLTSIQIYNNDLDGALPDEIGNLKNLTYLDLHKNSIPGPIPATIGNLKDLMILDLKSNELSGNIPSTIGNLTNLIRLELHDNQLSGQIPPEIGNLVNITFLTLNNNHLEGEIPSVVTKLNTINLSDNKFTSLAEEITHTNLKEINLTNNKLRAVPQSWMKLNELTSFVAANNEISELPDIIGASWPKLKLFDLSNNGISDLPDNFGAWPKLERLIMSDNKVEKFPVELCYLNNIRDIFFDNNKLRSLPQSITNLFDIYILDLDHNEISGQILSKLLMTEAIGSNVGVHFAYNKFTYDDVEELPEGEFYKRPLNNSKIVEVKDSVVKISPDKETRIDIRELTGMTHPTNKYYWFEYPENFNDTYLRYDYSSETTSPYLIIDPEQPKLAKKYYCKIINNDAGSAFLSNVNRTIPVIPFLNCEAITLEFMSDEEQVESLYPESHLLYSENLENGEIKDKKVTLAAPFSKRGQMDWEVSLDNQSWHKLDENMEHKELFDNVSLIAEEELVLSPTVTAWYRASLKEGNCDPLLSRSVKVSPYQEKLLADTLINVKDKIFTIAVDSIEVTIPEGLSEESFRLTISKVLDPPNSPEGTTVSSVYDVSVDLAHEFNGAIEIKLKNINVPEIDEFMVPEIKPVYFDEIRKEWVEYEAGGISYEDNCVYFRTDHLTKLGWIEKAANPTYTHKLENDKVKIIYRYKKDSNEFKHFNLYWSLNINQNPSQPWHNSNDDPDKGGAPYMIQDIAEYMKQIITKFEEEGLSNQLKRKFIVYVGYTGGKIKDLFGYDQAFGYITSSGYSNGYFYINSGMANYSNDVKRTLAHEYMHFIQSKYFNVSSSNYFFAEAHAPLADRMVWGSNELEIPEPEANFTEAKAKTKNHKSIFDLLSKSWDASTITIGSTAEKIFVNSADANVASAFLHYIRSYSNKKLSPAQVLINYPNYKYTNFAWRSYLDAYLTDSLSTSLGDEYDKYVQYVFSGENKNFTLLNVEGGNPYTHLLNNIEKNDKGSYVERVHWEFKPDEEDEIEPEVKKFSYTTPYLASKVLYLENNSKETPIIVNYKRLSDIKENETVYYGYYDYKQDKLTFMEITDSLEHYMFLEMKNDENSGKYNNMAILLFVNKKCPTLTTVLNRNFNIDFELTANPAINFNNVAYAYVGADNEKIHQYSDGSYGDFVFTGKVNTGSLWGMFSENQFTIIDSDYNRYQVDAQTIAIESEVKDRMEIYNGLALPKSITEREVKQTAFYNIVTGDMIIINSSMTRISFSAYVDPWNEEHEAYTSHVITQDQQIELREIKDIEYNLKSDLYGNHHQFETAKTEETLKYVKRVSDKVRTIHYNNKGEVTGDNTKTLVDSDYSLPNVKLLLRLRY